MFINHIALWAEDIELLKDFYTKYFQCTANNKYRNELKSFESYFISFGSGARLEIMKTPDVRKINDVDVRTSFAHLALSVGSKELVIERTNRLKDDGFIIKSEPRLTGDGYFESIVLDPEGNEIEITI